MPLEGMFIPSRRTVITLGLTVVLVLAGCAGGPIEPDQGTELAPESTTPSVEKPPSTPSPVNVSANRQATGSVDFANAPPGVNKSGIQMSTLLRSHLRSLGENSHTITIQQQSQRQGQPQSSQRIVRVNNDSVSVTKRQSGRNSEAWTNGSLTARRYKASGAANDTRFSFNETPIRIQQVSGQRLLIGLLTATNFSAVETTQQRGRNITILQSTGKPDERIKRQLFRAQNLTAYDVRVGATERGRIDGLALNVTTSQGTKLRYRYVLTRVGSTSVDKPQWIDEASRRATRLNATLGGNESYLAVEQIGGDPIPANARIRWSSGPSKRPSGARIDRAITPGDTVYVSVVNDSLRFSRSPPANGTTDRLSNGLFLQFSTAKGVPIASAFDIPAKPSRNASAPRTTP